MHPYHIQEATAERVSSKMRSAEKYALIAEARASAQADDPCAEPARRGTGFRIPFFNWELRMQPARPARAGQ
jgi:hypothetical protein